jgi:hypothetical protein
MAGGDKSRVRDGALGILLQRNKNACTPSEFPYNSSMLHCNIAQMVWR